MDEYIQEKVVGTKMTGKMDDALTRSLMLLHTHILGNF